MSFKKENLGKRESTLKQNAAQRSICVTTKNKKNHKGNPNNWEKGGRRGNKRKPIGRNKVRIGIKGDSI